MGIKRTLNMMQNIENWGGYLAYKMGGKKAPVFIFRMRNQFSIDVPRQILPEFKESVFDEQYFKFLPKKIKEIKNPIVLDIGANLGFFTAFAYFKLNHPHIYSFEPMKRNFLRLEDNLKSIQKQNITLINKAINDKPGELVLKFNDSLEFTTSASLFYNLLGRDEETVKATTLEEEFAEHKLHKIDVLKLDCEGAEYNIFYNTPVSFFDKVNSIAMETHLGKADNENNASLAKYIKGLGFEVKTKKEFICAYKNPNKWVL